MSEYYKPNISEFHIGFEYEQWDTGSQRHKHITAKTIHHINHASVLLREVSMRGSLVRVKYLDEQDLEELGWSKVEDYFIYKDDPRAYYELTIDKYRGLIVIESCYETGPGKWAKHIVFLGKIKNKSEFKKLMSWLDITHH